MFQLQHIHDTWWCRPASPERAVEAEACLIVSEGDLDYTRLCIVFFLDFVFFTVYVINILFPNRVYFVIVQSFVERLRGGCFRRRKSKHWGI